MYHILLIESGDPVIQRFLEGTSVPGYVLHVTSNSEEAMSLMGLIDYDLVISNHCDCRSLELPRLCGNKLSHIALMNGVKNAIIVHDCTKKVPVPVGSLAIRSGTLDLQELWYRIFSLMENKRLSSDTGHVGNLYMPGALD